jgi:ferredoxin
MAQAVYEKLVDSLRARGGALPALACNEFYALMENMFSPAEADLANRLPLMPIPVTELSNNLKADAKQLERTLETMADKGLVYTLDRAGVRHYVLLPLLPGIFEMQFLRGDVNERAVRLAHLFDDYFHAMEKAYSTATESSIPFPMARVVAVEKEIPAGHTVHTYDMVTSYIEKAEFIAVGNCYCRHHGELLGKPCDKPKEVCMALGPDAKYIIERGFARQVSKQEALKVVEKAERAGLVHCSSNMSKYIQFICNCCMCHCGILQSMKKYKVKGSAAVSSYVCSLDNDQCISCGDCVERCPMGALTQNQDELFFQESWCIGCGLCTSACTTGALSLSVRPGAPVPPADWRELNLKLLSSIHQS